MAPRRLRGGGLGFRPDDARSPAEGGSGGGAGGLRRGPGSRYLPWPRFSVVVCTHNGGRTLAKPQPARRLDYANYEVIVVNDGSTDHSAAVAAAHGVRLISTGNGGLSNARNRGLEAATGEIVAYLDDDAYPDPQWLKYLASIFLATAHSGVEGRTAASG